MATAGAGAGAARGGPLLAAIRPVVSARTWLAVVHLLTGLVTGLVGFLLALISVVGAALLILPFVGLPMLAATLALCAVFARAERARFAALLGARMSAPRRSLDPVTSWWRRAWHALTAPARLRQLGYAAARCPLSMVEVTLRPTAAGVAVSSRCVVPTGTCSGALDVTVPAGLPVLASDANGNLTASGLSGQVTLSAGSGDLRVGRLSGTVSLSDNSGEIIASGLSGRSVRLSNGSGDIDATGLSAAAVTMLDNSGDITVTGLGAADVTGHAQFGNITLTFTKVPRRVDVTDSSGDVTLVLPPGPGYYDISALSSSGGISLGVKRRSSSPYVITANVGSGDITIRY